MQQRTLLINCRTLKGLLQKDVAEKIGVTTSYYGMVEQGVRNPTLTIAKRIADVFEKNIDDLFFAHADNNKLLGVDDQNSA